MTFWQNRNKPFVVERPYSTHAVMVARLTSFVKMVDEKQRKKLFNLLNHTADWKLENNKRDFATYPF